ncbi:hypothetical protein BV898_14867 [Hypsibius exemplaris]|uniref:Uncharacterized protein n=1 Tax=Hypsibius exemplaris TaxID=2072580 RepID=A0A9X6NCY5_HYPEX|nr:hypothetical protein BV898_14867 [Hypsibius exemplaris]
MIRLKLVRRSNISDGMHRPMTAAQMKSKLLQIQLAARDVKQRYVAKWGSDEPTGTKQEIIVHFFLLFPFGNSDHLKSVSFMECLSLLSVLKNLHPDRTMIHTNVPDFWPFGNCSDVIGDWTSVEIVPVRRKFLMQGKRFASIQHEADVMKIEALIQHGGLALDFDVFIINGERVRQMMRTLPCFMCDEKYPDLLNADFIGCQKGSRFPRLMLERYHTDFRPQSWLWNSGRTSFKLAVEDPLLVELVPEICNIPTEDRPNVLEQRGYYNWTDKIAYHTFYHNRSLTASTLKTMNSSFGDLLNWIISNDSLPSL